MMHFTVEEENLICMYHNADRRRTIGKITAAMPGYGRGYVDACVRRLFFLPVPTHLEPSIDGDRIKYSPTSANMREKL